MNLRKMLIVLISLMSLALIVVVGSRSAAGQQSSNAEGINYLPILYAPEELTFNPDALRIMLFRTYIQTGGPEQIELPQLSVVIDGEEHDLPECPHHDDALAADYTAVRNALANGASWETILRLLRQAANIPDPEIVGGSHLFCGWWLPLSALNIAYPDTAAVYWIQPIFTEFIDEMIVRGQFANARYTSFTIYNNKLESYNYTLADGEVLTSYIPDFQIEPDAGSENPWMVDADPGGDYTLYLKKEIQSAEPNVVPLLQDPEDDSEALANNGIFRMPAPCNTPGSPYACTPSALFQAPPAGAQSGFLDNPDNAYLPAPLTADEANRVVVVRGKLPATPAGSSPVPWPNDVYDMRYWSFCTGIYARPYPTIPEDGCVTDADIVTDEQGYFTLVLSTEEARPDNTEKADGVNWLKTVSEVNNILIVRNMMADSFEYAIQNVPKDGAWTSAYQALGDYYPLITVICTTEHYNENGGWEACKAPRG